MLSLQSAPTLILPPRLNNDAKAVRVAALDNGWKVFQATGWQIPPGLIWNEPVIYADPLFADVAAVELTVSLRDPNADWLASLPEKHTHRLIRFATLQEARAYTGGPWFLKPAEDKSFPAQVYASASELPDENQLPHDLPVLISEPVHWHIEVRCFVLDGQIAALSPYFRDGELAATEDEKWPFAGDEEQEATAFATHVLETERLSLPSAFVLDVGIIKDRGWAVVEANPAWGSGIYGCDPAQVLPVLRRATIQRDCPLTPQERRFIRPHIQIER